MSCLYPRCLFHLRSIAPLLCLLIACDSLFKMALSSLFPNRFSLNNSNQGQTPNGASWPQAMKQALWKRTEVFVRWKFLAQVFTEAIYLQKFCTHLWSHGDRRWSGPPAHHCYLFPETVLYGSSAMISASQTGMAAMPPGEKGNAGGSQVPLSSHDVPRGHRYSWTCVNYLWRWQLSHTECVLGISGKVLGGRVAPGVGDGQGLLRAGHSWFQPAPATPLQGHGWAPQPSW